MIGFSVVQFFSISIILTALIYVVVSGNILVYLFIFFSPGHSDQHWGWLRHTISRNIQRSSDCCRDSGSCTGSKVSAHLPSHISYFQEHYNNKCGALLTLVVTQCVLLRNMSAMCMLTVWGAAVPSCVMFTLISCRGCDDWLAPFSSNDVVSVI